MPRYSFETWRFPGSVEPETYCKVFCNCGKEPSEIPWVMMVDTDTGEVIRQFRDGEGNPILNKDRSEVMEIREFFPLPIRLIPHRIESNEPLIVENA